MKKIAKLLTIVFSFLIITVIFIGGGFGENHKTLLDGNKPVVFAHRGSTQFNVENSLEAFEEAKKMGFSAIETDLVSTKDGKLIIFHDDSAKRLLGIDQLIKDLDWEDIKNEYLLLDGLASRSKLLTLHEFLSQQSDSIRIYLDLKVVSKSIASELLSTIGESEERKRVIVADANILFLAYLKFKNPEILVALEGFNKGKEWLYYIIPKKFKPDYYASFLHKVDEKHVEFLRKKNLLERKIVYGVNSENLSEVYRLGIQNIIYDHDEDSRKVEEINTLLMSNKYQESEL